MSIRVLDNVPNQRAVLDAGGSRFLHLERHWPGPSERGCYAGGNVNHIATVLLLMLTALCTACAKPDVKYSDLQPATTATIASNSVTLHLGSDLMASACWTRPNATVEDGIVYVVGYRTMQKQSHEFVVRLPSPRNPRPMSVVWLDPDGKRVAVPTVK